MLVVEDARLVGIFTERDVVRRVLVKRRSPEETPLEHVMTTDLLTARRDSELREAVEKMHRAGCRHLPVLVEGHGADTLSMRDLLFEQLSDTRKTVGELRSYIRGDRTP